MLKVLGSRKAQSTLEYVIVFTAIVAAIIVFANTVMRQKVQSSLTTTADKMETQVNKIDFGGQ
ncbi:MAG: hypothetical protein PHJ00_01535 [Candidatus Omnitrophica bacterium]|jgi:TRAP-type C4-dicarboxylate transport system permease small subunit|nr:hypothetical protein [Candidatus Omnitrophota bacterium]MDD5654772.1 hypothetical protein [Candidatus Omnitrophota bacterium]